MREGASGMCHLEEGSSRALMVGSDSLKVALGSRQAPPWMNLYLGRWLCETSWSFEGIQGAERGRFIEELTHTSQYLVVPGAGSATLSLGNSQTAPFCRTLSLP